MREGRGAPIRSRAIALTASTALNAFFFLFFFFPFLGISLILP